MNNIEIKNLPGLKPGMTDKQINELKSGKKIEPVVTEKVIKKKLPSIQIKEEEIINLVKLNLVKDEADNRDFKLSAVPMGLPKSIDWTNTMSPVKNQGHLGSCVGFATAAMKEWQEQQEHDREVAEGKRDHRKEIDYYDLSEQWIYYKCKTIDPWPNEEGTSIRCAMQVLQKIGVPCEEAYPYNDDFKGEPESWAKLIAKWGLIDSYWRCTDLPTLKTALVDGPVVGGIACFKEIFYVGSNGYIPYPSNPNEIYGGHAICFVGYDDNTQCVKFKNSWGTGWGNKGYGLLPYSYIRDFMWDSWVAIDLAVTKKILNERAMDELV